MQEAVREELNFHSKINLNKKILRAFTNEISPARKNIAIFNKEYNLNELTQIAIMNKKTKAKLLELKEVIMFDKLCAISINEYVPDGSIIICEKDYVLSSQSVINFKKIG